MHSSGKSRWLGRLSLAVYLLLVCFGHALHALPGHQHGHSGNCGCSSAIENSSPEEHCHTGTCSTTDRSTTVCPFGHDDRTAKGCHANERTLASVEEALKATSDLVEYPISLRGLPAFDYCSICDLLTSPQFAAVIFDWCPAAEPLATSVDTLYAYSAADALAAFLARGPPNLSV